MTKLVISFALSFAAGLAACAGPTTSSCADSDNCPPDRPDASVQMPPQCGNGTCEAPETATSCPADCHTCGDGTCNANETAASCPADCASCGDGVCSSTETGQSCPADCDATLILDNTSSFTIQYFYAWPCSGSNSFVNILAQPLPPNFHTTFTSPPGCWNIQADTANHAQTAQDLNIILTAGHTFTWTLHN